ncbi:MAG: hypothetical protein D6706_07870, partial [Chloroflexi bacterium]
MPEDLRTVTKEYLLKRYINTPTYIYYGAVPGSRYQLSLETNTKNPIPADWYRDCWAGKSNSYCAEENIFYGRWIRQLSPVEQSEEILSTISASASPNMEFWIIFSHTSND